METIPIDLCAFNVNSWGEQIRSYIDEKQIKVEEGIRLVHTMWADRNSNEYYFDLILMAVKAQATT